ncbi:MAG: hypothetical protein AAGA54_09410 [Myxococcota bacterium]
MLIACPECAHKVSDRAAACPQCGFPIAETVAAEREAAEAEAEKKSRTHVGEVDCPSCDARGFTTEVDEDDRPTSFSWCSHCESSGRRPLVQSSRGYWAVAFASLDAFLAGEGLDAPNAVYLGETKPESFRYPKAGPRHKAE